MAKADSETLEKYLVQVRRIAESREKGAEKEILKLYNELVSELNGFLGNEYAKYADDEGKLTNEILYRKGEYARFLEEVNKRLDTVPPKVRDEVSTLINDTYEQCWQGMIDGVSKAKDVSDLKQGFSSIRAVRPEVVKAAVENPIPKLRLTPTLERNRKDVIYEIKREIGVGLSQGDTMATMARRITKRVDINYRQSMLIARTEAHRVRETGLNDASQKVDEILKEHGSEYRKVKIWNTSGDSSVRDTHAKMDGVAVLVDEEFELPSGAKAKCPGTSGVAAEDCNCRCFLTYDIVTDAEFYALAGRHFPDYDAKNSKSGLTKSAASDTIISGAVSGALNDNNDPTFIRRERHAKRYYASMKNSDRDVMCKTISDNSGVDKATVETALKHILDSKYELSSGYGNFYPDYDMSESIQRLRLGKGIQEHDVILLHHEALEAHYMDDLGMNYSQAHNLTDEKYNYKAALDEWKKK